MGAGRRWPGLFGSLVDGIVQSYRAHDTEKLNGGSVVVSGHHEQRIGLFAEHDRLG